MDACLRSATPHAWGYAKVKYHARIRSIKDQDAEYVLDLRSCMANEMYLTNPLAPSSFQ